MIGQPEDGPTMLYLDGLGDLADVLQSARGLDELRWFPAAIVRLEDPSQIASMAPDELVGARFIDKGEIVLRTRILKHTFVLPHTGGGRLVVDDHHGGPNSFRDGELRRMRIVVGAALLLRRFGDRRKGHLSKQAVCQPFFLAVN